MGTQAALTPCFLFQSGMNQKIHSEYLKKLFTVRHELQLPTISVTDWPLAAPENGTSSLVFLLPET